MQLNAAGVVKGELENFIGGRGPKKGVCEKIGGGADTPLQTMYEAYLIVFVIYYNKIFKYF